MWEENALLHRTLQKGTERWVDSKGEVEKGMSGNGKRLQWFRDGKIIAHSEMFEQTVYLEPKDQARKTSETNLK